MEDCIFCKIAAGQVPTRKVHHEDETIVSFLDINQDVPGHTLVIPVDHYRWFYEVPEDITARLFRAASKVAALLKEEWRADYVQLSVVGLDIPHVHVHLFPRSFKDKPPKV